MLEGHDPSFDESEPVQIQEEELKHPEYKPVPYKVNHFEEPSYAPEMVSSNDSDPKEEISYEPDALAQSTLEPIPDEIPSEAPPQRQCKEKVVEYA